MVVGSAAVKLILPIYCSQAWDRQVDIQSKTRLKSGERVRVLQYLRRALNRCEMLQWHHSSPVKCICLTGSCMWRVDDCCWQAVGWCLTDECVMNFMSSEIKQMIWSWRLIGYTQLASQLKAWNEDVVLFIRWCRTWSCYCFAEF